MGPIGILYEHPQWFALLFAELERRGIPYVPLFAPAHEFDPAHREVPFSLMVNRVSPSSYLRDHATAILYARQYLAYLRNLRVPVVNGYDAFTLETSKALQLLLLERLGLPYPRTRVVNHPSRLGHAAAGLTFPVIVKPNVGGSGALMQRFQTAVELEQAGAAGTVDFGVDDTALVQEYLAPAGGAIVRLEVLAGELLYAIKIHTDPDDGFNLCPADICRVDAPSQAKRPLQIEAYQPPAAIVSQALQLVAAGGLDVGGVEYLVSERDGRHYFYDLNALSNFVTDAPTLLGFDPTARFVDYLVERARSAAPALVGG